MTFLKRFPFRRQAPAGPQNEGISVLDLLASHSRRVEPQLPPPTPHGKTRIHLFAGHFANHEVARHYCFFEGPDRASDLTNDLPHAYIDTSHVEVCFDDHINRLGAFLLPADAAAIGRKIGDDNTLVIISEPAFGGLAYALDDTPRLRYLGPLVVAT